MWRIRTRSSSRILDLGRPQDSVAEIPAEILRRAQVDLFPAQHRGQLGFHHGQPEEARLTAGLELHQEVDVAFWPSGTPERRTKQGQASDVLPPAEPRQLFICDRQAGHRSFRSWRVRLVNEDASTAGGRTS